MKYEIVTTDNCVHIVPSYEQHDHTLSVDCFCNPNTGVSPEYGFAIIHKDALDREVGVVSPPAHVPAAGPGDNQ